MRRGLLLLGVFATLALAEQPAPVILISIDTLRADHLSAYGYRRIRTPHIDSFAQHGTLFTNVEAQIPFTLPSHTSLFTSTYPFENQIEENAERVPAGAVTLASLLRSQGYKTAAFIGSVFLESEMGLDQGFEVYDSPFHFEAFSPLAGSMFFGGMGRNPFSVRDRRDGALVLGAARRWLAANRGQPAFVFVHLFDVHKPYVRPGYD
jgi:choline-sulfatase